LRAKMDSGENTQCSDAFYRVAEGAERTTDRLRWVRFQWWSTVTRRGTGGNGAVSRLAALYRRETGRRANDGGSRPRLKAVAQARSRG
jgi:hypothetical protein